MRQGERHDDPAALAGQVEDPRPHVGDQPDLPERPEAQRQRLPDPFEPSQAESDSTPPGNGPVYAARRRHEESVRGHDGPLRRLEPPHHASDRREARHADSDSGIRGAARRACPDEDPMPVVTAPSASHYDRTPGVLYEEKSAPGPTATATVRREIPPAAAAPARPTPTVTPARPTATARPSATAVKEAAPAPRTPTPARPTATPTRAAPTATPVPPTATSAPPTETRIPPTTTSTPAGAASARPTATRKPGAYYEGEEVPFRLAVTFTFTPTPPLKHRS